MTVASTDLVLRLFGRYLRDQGLPVTHQREIVADVVFSSDEHLSVDDIEKLLRERGERIGKATIYRTLDLLVRSRLVEEHDFNEGAILGITGEVRSLDKMATELNDRFDVCLDAARTYVQNNALPMQPPTQVEVTSNQIPTSMVEPEREQIEEE